jgi:Predicted metal-dependent hydrolase with the TIM-barrel fold
LDGHQGAWLMQEGLYRSVFKLFWDGGYQIHIHQNGDEALDLILDVLEENMENQSQRRSSNNHCTLWNL